MRILPRAMSTALDLQTFTTPPVGIASAPALDPMLAAITRARAEKITRDEAMSIPAVRRGVHVIAGTISTFALAAWTGTARVPADMAPSWLAQPDPRRTLQSTLRATVDDLIWRDRAHWLPVRDVGGRVKYSTRINPARVLAVHNPDDVDAAPRYLLDGDVRRGRDLLTFDGAGLGGLEVLGVPLLTLYLKLQTAAGTYAEAPHPKAILRNSGDDLSTDEIEALLASWEAARAVRSVGYINDALTYDTYGWNSQEMQLTEAREHAALEVARLLGLPARAVNAASNDSMTYSNDAAARRDILEAIRPWMTVVEQTLSLDDRSSSNPAGIMVPRGTNIRFDATAYTRDDPTIRMAYWATALTNGILTLDEIRAQEPLAWK